MFFDILKRDLKRKKTMNLILLIFIVLASLFVASSVNNIVTVMNGTDYYFDQAGIGDYVLLTMGENAKGSLDSVLQRDDIITGYRLEDVIYASKDKFYHNGEMLEMRNVNLLQSLDQAEMNFFNEKNEMLSTVEPGKVYVTGSCMEKNGLKIGDLVEIKHGDVDITLEIAGRLKDALFGSAFMGNYRFLMSDEDFAKFANDELLQSHYYGQVAYLDVTSVNKVENLLIDAGNLAFDGSRSMIKMCYMMDMIVAAILLVVSICLIIVSFVVLKFTITFTLTEEFREIGVMKAIGIRNWKIRSLYLTKYLVISIVGSILGFAGSIPFSKLMIQSVSENMVLGNDKGILLNIFSAIAVVIVVILFAYLCTKKVKKYSPIDAIRSGQTGERFRKKSVYKLSKSRLSNTGYMAVNDIISSPRRYLTIFISFFICSILVLVLVNTTTTIQSDSLVTTFGKASDIYFENDNETMISMSGEGHENIDKTLREYEELFAENGMPGVATIDLQFKFPVEFDGESFQISCQQGMNTKVVDYEFYEGTAPQNQYEIALTEVISKKIGAKIGDEVWITINGEKHAYLVTAYFDSMNLLGEIIRLHEDVPTNLSDASSAMNFQFDFSDNPDQKTIDERVKKIKKILDNEEVYNAAEYTAECIGVVDTMLSVEYLLVGITIIVVILVTILMERSFLSQEKGEIAILKAIGFKNKTILGWHMKRFAIVSLLAVLFAIALSVPMTHLCISPIFKSMGMHSMQYDIDALQVFVIFPLLILAVTLLAALLTGSFMKKINSRDTASIE